MSSRFWQAIDTAAHKLSLPKPLRRRICDRFDLSLGVTRDELHRKAPQLAARRRTPPESWREDWDSPEDGVYDA